MSESERKPSYGWIEVNRVSGGSGRLFGSSIENQHMVRVAISGASRRRHLAQDWIYSDGRPLVEVLMSPAQWAEFVSSFGTSGTPCTLRYTKESGHITHEAEPEIRMQFEQDFEQRMRKQNAAARNLQAQAKEYLERPGTLKKDEKTELANLINEMVRVTDDYVPFIASQFNEQMDRTVTEAKSEFDAWQTHQIIRAGLTALGLDTKALTEGEK